MRSRSVTIPLLLALAIAGACTKKSSTKKRVESLTELYGLKSVPVFDVKLSEKDIESLRTHPRDWVRGDFEYEGLTLKKIAVRLKGHRSLRSIDDKPAFKFRFDKGKKHKERRFLGVRRLTLNNLVDDATMLREYLGYRLAHEVGLPAPKAGFARLRVNGSEYGLYLVIETHDEDFLQREFGDGSGELYEGEYGCDLFVEDVEGFDLDVGDDGDRSKLRAFAEAAAGTGDELWNGPHAPLELSHLATFLAFATYVGDFDGYHHSHNYRIYRRPKDDKWQLMSWGLDRGFFKRLTPYSSQGLLAKRCFANQECRLAYLVALRSVDAAAKELNLVQGSKVVSSIIADAVNADSRRPYKAERINKSRKRLREFLLTRGDDIKKMTQCIDPDGTEIDADGDGFGCLDCDDTDASTYPGADEACDGIDNSCSGLIDDSASCPCSTETFESDRFAFCDLAMPRHQAESHCQQLGATLAKAKSQGQLDAIYKHAQSLRVDRWWLGANDVLLEGNFVWPDGSTLDPKFWGRDEPDNEGCNQDCVVIKDGKKPRVYDTHCGQHRPFVCQFGATE